MRTVDDDPHPVAFREEEAEETRGRLTRRGLLAGGGAAAALVVAAPAVSRAQATDAPMVETGISTDSLPRPFREARVFQASSGQLRLDVAPLPITYPKETGEIITEITRAYNGDVPGPTIVAKAGETISILLRNRLPAKSGDCLDFCDDPNAVPDGKPHCFNTTNLHTHGLHVSPESIWQGDKPACGTHPMPLPKKASDDVTIEIAPGQQQEYCIVLPTFHAPGTHWYHSHKHGSTAIQVNNGMAGALIVPDPPSQPIVDVPHDDVIWLIQEVLAGDDAQLVYARSGAINSKFLINGVFQPTLNITAGSIQRWRFINGTSRPRGLAQLQLWKCSDDPAGSCDDSITGTKQETVYTIAIDGIALYGSSPQPTTGFDFAPGNRVDFLVYLPEPGIYKVVKAPHPASSGNDPGNQVLGFVRVSSTAPATEALPPVLTRTIPVAWRPCYLDPVTDAEVKGNPAPTVTFSMPGTTPTITKCADGSPLPSTIKPLPNAFLIDGNRYDPCRIDHPVPLGQAQEWTIVNVGGAGHPFHIHVNPFQIVSLTDSSGKTTNIPLDQRVWWDTFSLPPNGKMVIRQRFLHYHGTYVLHCHFLNHEDLGMMQNVEVVDNGKGIGPCMPLMVCSKT